MFTRGCGILFVGVSFVAFVPWGMAQETSGSRKGHHHHREHDGLINRIIHLMPTSFEAELNLTSEQRGRIHKLDEEFRAKRRETLIRTAVRVITIVEGMKEEDHEPAPVLAICHEITGGLLESRRTRMAYEKKMLALLDHRQRDKFVYLKEMSPRERRHHQIAADGVEEAEVRQTPSTRRYDNLQLTDEQKRKVLQLTEEMDRRFRHLLTDEQRQRLDEQCDQERSKKRGTR